MADSPEHLSVWAKVIGTLLLISYLRWVWQTSPALHEWRRSIFGPKRDSATRYPPTAAQPAPNPIMGTKGNGHLDGIAQAKPDAFQTLSISRPAGEIQDHDERMAVLRSEQGRVEADVHRWFYASISEATEMVNKQGRQLTTEDVEAVQRRCNKVSHPRDETVQEWLARVYRENPGTDPAAVEARQKLFELAERESRAEVLALEATAAARERLRRADGGKPFWSA